MKDENSDAYAQAVAFCALSSLFFAVILLFRRNFQLLIPLNLLPLMIVAGFLTSMGMVFTFKGFKFVGASEHNILLTSSRLWLMLWAILFLHENLTLAKLVGTIFILFGVGLAEWKKQAFKFNKGALYVLLAAFFFATSETISFFIIRSFDVLSYMLYGSIFITTILVVLRPKIIKKLSFYFKPKRALNIIITSSNDALANICGYTAYQIGRNALQIGPLGATGTLVTVLMAIIFLKERDNLLQKIVAAVLAVFGAILLL